MNRVKLNEWVNQKMNSQNLSMRELGRRSGVDHSAISKVLSSRREAGLEFYIKMAQTFNAVPEMLQIAEVFLPDEEEDISLIEAIKASKSLSRERRQLLREYLKFLQELDKQQSSAASDVTGGVVDTG